MFLRSTTASIIRFVCGQEFSVIAVGLDAPSPALRGFRPLSSEVVTGISARLSASADSIEIPASLPILHVQAFGPVDRPTMPSADFCLSIPPPLDDSSTWQTDRPPRVMHTCLGAYARRIYDYAFRTAIGL